MPFFNVQFQGLHYHNEDNPSKTNKMMRILMFVRILSLIRLARVSRLVRFFNEVEKVSSNFRQCSKPYLCNSIRFSSHLLDPFKSAEK